METRIIVFFFFVLFFFLKSSAQQQGLDSSFGNNGIVITKSPYFIAGSVYDIAIHYDGKIIVAGSGGGALAIKYLIDGSLDKLFGKNGIFLFSSSASFAPKANVVTLQSDNKILLGGSYRPPHTSQLEKFLLIRLLSDGRLDLEFATGGVDTSAFYEQCGPTAMAVQQDGKILLGGHYSGKIALARYMPNGGLDSSFGDNGMALIANGPVGGNVSNIEVLADGRILLGGDGYMEYAPGDYRDAFMLTRLLQDGRLDTTFNHKGQVYHRICNCYNYGQAMKLLPNGKILMAGYSNGGNLLRINTDGSLDTTFNHTGISTVDSAEIRSNIVVGPDGKIWIGGTRNTDFAVYRFLPEGKLDSAFGEDGKITTKILRKDNRIYAMALQRDGKLVVGGYSRDTFTTPNIITMARYVPDGKTDMETQRPAVNEEVGVYPNPANTYLFFKNNSDKKIKKISIVSADGRTVIQKTFLKDNKISLDNIANGIYTVHILLDNQQMVKQKIVILQQ